MLYYAKIRGRMCGPFPVEAVLEMISRGQIGRTSQVSTDGTNWCLAGQREDLFPLEHRSEEPNIPPVAPTGPALSTTRQWYISNDGKTGTGPYSQQEISTLYQKQQFYADSLVWKDGVNPATLKSSPDFSFLFQASVEDSDYSSASTSGIQASPSSFSADADALISSAQGSQSPGKATAAGLSRDVIQSVARPIVWLFTINLFFSLGIIVELVSCIYGIRSLIDRDLHSGIVAFNVLSMFIVFAFSAWIVVEHWRFFGAVQAFGRESSEIRLITVGRRANSLCRVWAFFMLHFVVVSIACVIIIAFVAP